MTAVVYLIHLSTPLAHAKHYLGKSKHLAARVAHHRAGSGAHFLSVCNGAGIEYKVVRTWPDDGNGLERRLKNQKNSPRLCPVCCGEIEYNDVEEEL